MILLRQSFHNRYLKKYYCTCQPLRPSSAQPNLFQFQSELKTEKKSFKLFLDDKRSFLPLLRLTELLLGSGINARRKSEEREHTRIKSQGTWAEVFLLPLKLLHLPNPCSAGCQRSKKNLRLFSPSRFSPPEIWGKKRSLNFKVASETIRLRGTCNPSENGNELFIS